MHRISPDNPVRRRLFADDDTTDQARMDNFANVLQESVARDRIEKKNKWNFDFENEVPLEGDYEWYRTDGNNGWIGMKVDTKTEVTDDNEQDTFLPMQKENEATPKTNKDDESAPLIRKRRTDDVDNVTNDNGVRRRLSFD